MKKIKAISLVILSLIMAFTLTSCAHIKDTNGKDDYSLNTITDEEIINSTSSVVSTSIGIQKGDEYTYKFGKISGVKVITTFDFTGYLLVETNLEITKGNAKLVLVNDGKIIKTFNNNQADNYFGRISGKCYLKLAGESAKVTLTIEAKQGV